MRRSILKISVAAGMTLILSASAASAFDPLKSLSDVFTPAKSGKKKNHPAKAGVDATTGCVAGALLAKAGKQDAGQGCIAGAIQNVTAENEKEQKLEALEQAQKKAAAERETRIQALNRQVVTQQSQVSQIKAQEASAPADLTTRTKRWLMPASVPEVKDTLQTLDTDAKTAETFVAETQAQIKEKEQRIHVTVDLQERLILVREVGDLYSDLKQAEYAQASSIAMKKQLDDGKPGMLASVLGVLATLVAGVRNKILDDVYKKVRDKSGHVINGAMKRYLAKQQTHRMY